MHRPGRWQHRTMHRPGRWRHQPMHRRLMSRPVRGAYGLLGTLNIFFGSNVLHTGLWQHYLGLHIIFSIFGKSQIFPNLRARAPAASTHASSTRATTCTLAASTHASTGRLEHQLMHRPGRWQHRLMDRRMHRLGRWHHRLMHQHAMRGRKPPGPVARFRNFEVGEGRIGATRAESQWIVAARPLCHLQYPVAYLSRLQRILPAGRWELRFKASRTARPPRGVRQRHVPLGAEAPTAGRQTDGGRMRRF